MVYWNKKIFKNREGEIHIGINAPEGFKAGSISDVKKALKNPGKMKFWRCHVCNDLHIGLTFPNPCPTCFVNDSFIEVTESEIKNLMEVK